MSYVLQIWKQVQPEPLPRTVREAAVTIDELSQVEQRTAEFSALAQRLTARYPCICSPAMEESDPDEWAWSDGPLDGDSDVAVYGIGLNPDRVEEVRPFVVDTARGLGLHVFDEQAGECFLSNGTVLRMT